MSYRSFLTKLYARLPLLISLHGAILQQVIIVILLTRALATILQYLKQPRVIAEVSEWIL